MKKYIVLIAVLGMLGACGKSEEETTHTGVATKDNQKIEAINNTQEAESEVATPATTKSTDSE